MRSTFFEKSRLRAWWGGLGHRANPGGAEPAEFCRAGIDTLPSTEAATPATPPTDAVTLEDYLSALDNFPEDTLKCRSVRSLPKQVVEIGCGTADIAFQLALRNPDIGVWATDKFDCCGPGACGSGYRRVALAWKEKKLAAQQACPENCVVLRAEADLLYYLPPHSIDAVLLINPEPAVGEAVLARLATPAIYGKLKPGGRIVVLPYSREMGIMACGGLEFDHIPDWSRGLGFLQSSALAFFKAQRYQWGIDLAASRYTPNSTQSGTYIHTVAAEKVTVVGKGSIAGRP